MQTKTNRDVKKIIVHCSATRPSQDIGVEEINSWHNQRGFDGIGYHFVIRRNGEVEAGRDLDKIGAHTKGQNYGSIGICMVGGVSEKNVKIAEDNFSKEQFDKLAELIKELKKDNPKIKEIKGHYEFANKACPSFDVEEFVKNKGLDNDA